MGLGLGRGPPLLYAAQLHGRRVPANLIFSTQTFWELARHFSHGFDASDLFFLQFMRKLFNCTFSPNQIFTTQTFLNFASWPTRLVNLKSLAASLAGAATKSKIPRGFPRRRGH